MIIGITGTNGAGKGTIVDYLIKSKGFAHGSARALITEEVDQAGLPVNRDTLNMVGNKLRKTRGPGYIAEQLLARAQAHGGNAVLESIRSLGEAQYLQSKGALIWAIDADRKIRYERAVLRGSQTDKVTFEEFCAQEDREMQSTEPWDMNIFAIMQMADHVFLNNGTQEELFVQVEVELKKAGV